MPDTRTDTQGQVNLQQMAEMEYCLQKYYNENIAPMVSSVRKDLEAKKQSEASRYWKEQHSPFAEPSVTDHATIHKMEWNSKDSEYIVHESQRRLNDNASFRQDLSKFVQIYQAILQRDLGTQKYEILSKSLDCDLASYYVGQRFYDMNLRQLAQYELPLKSSLFVQSMERSLLGLGKMLTAQSQSSTEASVHDVADRLHNPSFGEQLKCELGAMAIDTGLYALTTGGVGLQTIGWDLVARVGILGYQNNTKTESEKREANASQWMFGNTEMQKRIVEESKKVRSSQSSFVQAINKELANKMKIQAYSPTISDDAIRQTQLYLIRNYVGKDKGERLLRLYGEIQEKAYGPFDDDDVEKWDSALGGIMGRFEPWMLKQDEKTLIKNATWWSSLYYHMVNMRKEQMNVNGKELSRRLVLINAFQYTEALYRKQHGHVSSFYPEYESEENGREVTADEFFKTTTHYVNNASNDPQRSERTSERHTSNSTTTNVDNRAPSTNPMQNGIVSHPFQSQNRTLQQQPAMMPMANNLTFWGSLFDTYGLSGFGQVGRNFGQVLAHLPEIMIGMFTGKLSNLKVKDNLLPLASIMIGLFLPARTNPFLKFLFLGLGGLNLLNKAGQSVLNDNPSPVRTYRKYDDEPLNSRITKPAVKGGTLLADFDGNPLVLKLSDNAVDAYNKGLLPLNTLANAALRSWDEQNEAITHNYESRQRKDEAIERKMR